MINVAGLVVIVVFYVIILGVGILAAKWFKDRNKENHDEVDATETSLLAGRQLGGLVGIFTMTGRSLSAC